MSLLLLFTHFDNKLKRCAIRIPTFKDTHVVGFKTKRFNRGDRLTTPYKFICIWLKHNNKIKKKTVGKVPNSKFQ